MPPTRKSGTRRRAQMSCDRCKSRKTKCIDPLPGPCQFCKSIGSTCKVDVSRRRQRPYYQVSEEEFRYMTRALEHFLPDTALNLDTLRDFVQGIDKPSEIVLVESPIIVSPPESISPCSTRPSLSEPSSSYSGTSLSLDEIDDIHLSTTWLRPDASGSLRYIGSESLYEFRDAVQSARRFRLPQGIDTGIFSTPTQDNLSPLPITGCTPAPTKSHKIFLPRRDLCEKCVTRFFDEIHSVYWLFPRDYFTTLLNKLYSRDSGAATASILCCIYAMLALTCDSEAKANSTEVPSTNPAARYLSLAKGLIPDLYSSGDIDSIRALCLLAIFHRNTCPYEACIYVSSAARIAYTLGLHIKRETHTRPMFQHQLELRIYCTLYILDMDVSLQFGSPPTLGYEDAVAELQLATEQILCAGGNIPPGYQLVACKLSQISRRIRSRLYSSPDMPRPNHSLADALECVSALHSWLDGLPITLRNYKDVLSIHSRSTSVLHLRYYSTMIFATRSFLIHSVVCMSDITTCTKRKTYQDFAMLCVDAATRSMDIIRHMKTSNILSSLIATDCTLIFEAIQVFLLVVAANKKRSSGADYRDKVYECFEILRDMEKTPTTEKVLAEISAQLQEYGILDSKNTFICQASPLDTLFLPTDDWESIEGEKLSMDLWGQELLFSSALERGDAEYGIV